MANETKHHLLQLKNRNLELLLQRAQEEIKLYVSSKTEDKKKSLREQLLKQVFWTYNRPAPKIVLSFSLQIADQEKRSKVLKEEQKKVKDSLSVASKQVSTTAVVLVQKHVFLASSRSMVFLQLPRYPFYFLGEVVE